LNRIDICPCELIKIMLCCKVL